MMSSAAKQPPSNSDSARALARPPNPRRARRRNSAAVQQQRAYRRVFNNSQLSRSNTSAEAGHPDDTHHQVDINNGCSNINPAKKLTALNSVFINSSFHSTDGARGKPGRSVAGPNCTNSSRGYRSSGYSSNSSTKSSVSSTNDASSTTASFSSPSAASSPIRSAAAVHSGSSGLPNYGAWSTRHPQQQQHSWSARTTVSSDACCLFACAVTYYTCLMMIVRQIG